MSSWINTYALVLAIHFQEPGTIAYMWLCVAAIVFADKRERGIVNL